MHEDPMTRPKASRSAGFSLIEMIVATASMSFVFGGSVLLLQGTRGAFEVGGNHSSLQEVGRRILDDVLSDLRRSGLTTVAGQNLPAVFERPVGNFLTPQGPLLATMSYTDVDLVDAVIAVQGNGNRINRNFGRNTNEILFQLPADTNGNGLPVDNNGNLTWGNEVISYRIISDPVTNIPTLFRLTQNGGMITGFRRMGMWVNNITFDVVFNDRSLRFGEIAVVIYLQRINARGQLITSSLEGSVGLRNTREL